MLTKEQIRRARKLGMTETRHDTRMPTRPTPRGAEPIDPRFVVKLGSKKPK